LDKKLEMRKLFNDRLKQGGNIETYLAESFKRKNPKPTPQ
jgi:hypothetical protein